MATPSEPKQEKSDADAADTRRPPASASVPAHIAARYLIEKDRYHFPDRQAAFVDRGARFTVQTQNTSVLKDLIAIAQARGWHGVQVPILLVSSLDQSELAGRARAAQAAGYVCKGAGMPELVRRCRELLEAA